MRKLVVISLIFSLHLTVYGQQKGKYVSFLFGSTSMMDNRSKTIGFNSSVNYTYFFIDRLGISTGIQMSLLHARLDPEPMQLPPDQQDPFDIPLRIDDRVLMASLPIWLNLNAFHAITERSEWNLNLITGIAIDTHLDAERTFSRGEARWSNKLNIFKTRYYLRYDFGTELSRSFFSETHVSLGFLMSDVFLSDYQYHRTVSSSLYVKISRSIGKE